MFERRTSPLLPRKAFLRRMQRSALLGAGISAATLFIGMCGYHFLEKMSWVDSFLNSAMLLSSMGPVGTLQTTAGKIFAGCYALFCGLVFVTIIAILVAPIFHRALHKFHMETGKEKT